MNRFCVNWLVLMVILSMPFLSAAQNDITGFRIKNIRPFRIAVSSVSTTNIIFPHAIISVDRGSADVLAQKAPGVENILQIKAARKDFEPTNISVITSGGEFFSFLVRYNERPALLNIEIARDSALPAKEDAVLSGVPASAAFFEALSTKASASEAFLNKSTRHQRMKLTLESIYLNGKLMLFGLKIDNRSMIDYHLSSIRFFVRDRKRSKRTVMQETEMLPVYKTEIPVVRGMGSQRVIYAFEPFTLPADRNLFIQVQERSGGRNFQLRVKPATLLKGRLLR